MAVRPNNSALFKGFTFDGIQSKDYGVYLTQEAAFAAPVRDVEMYEIAGRNGAYALDKGRFLNIEVTYKAAITATDEASFAQAISDLRNALCSRVGYKRLSDEYNPNEYRLAIYKSGLEVATTDALKAGEFDLVFDCKPQRYLISGETAQAVTSGGTLTNPTLFESHPLLQVWGYGDIDIEGNVISIDDAVVGEITLADPPRVPITGTSANIQFSESKLNSGDSITLSNNAMVTFDMFSTSEQYEISSPTILDVRDSGNIIKTTTIRDEDAGDGGVVFLKHYLNPVIFRAGTSATKIVEASISFNYTPNGGTTTNVIVECDFSVTYSTNEITFSAEIHPQSAPYITGKTHFLPVRVFAYSTKSALGEPLYFDLDIGEAYKEEGGEIIGVNNAVSFPAELPTLKAGANSITYDNTITQFKVVPRWWRV